jgi:hypothetical protein
MAGKSFCRSEHRDRTLHLGLSGQSNDWSSFNLAGLFAAAPSVVWPKTAILAIRTRLQCRTTGQRHVAKSSIEILRFQNWVLLRIENSGVRLKRSFYFGAGQPITGWCAELSPSGCNWSVGCYAMLDCEWIGARILKSVNGATAGCGRPR